MKYKAEFGNDFDLGFNLSNFPILVDNSWHNDQCPRFEWENYVLFVNYPDNDEYPRYCVYNRIVTEAGDIEVNYDIVHLETDSVSELITFLEGAAK